MKLKKFLSAVPAACLLLTGLSVTSAGAVDAKTVTSGAVVELFTDGKLAETINCGSPGDAWSQAFQRTEVNRTEAVITLGSDWTHDTVLTIGHGMRITIDLNGHYIRRSRNHDIKSDGELFKVEKNAVFTLRDSNPKVMGYDGVRGGVLTGGASGNSGGCVHIEEEGEFRMEGGTIYDCITDADGGAVNLEGSSLNTKFTMTGGRIYGCKTIDSANECYGGAVYMQKGTVTIKDAKIDGCYSEDDGGAIFSERGVINLDNVIFSGNHCREHGAVIRTAHDIAKYEATVVNARNCIFAGNHAEESGGAVYINDNPEHDQAVIFHNCKFRGNTAEYGGAVYVNDDNVVLSSCEITGNTAREDGGGVYVDGRYNVTLKGRMIIKDNSSNKGEGFNNLVLQNSTLGKARIINGGLYPGSIVYLSSSSDSSVLVSEWVSQYQAQYFKAEVGSLSPTDSRNVDAKMIVSASIFNDGKYFALMILGGAGVIATVFLIIRYYIKKKSKQGGEENA